MSLTLYKKYEFLVMIDGVIRAGFSRAGPLQAQIGVTSYQQGGSPIKIKTPSSVDFPDITLERGATDDLDIFEWFKETARHVLRAGTVDPSYERNLTIIQQDRSKSRTVAQWNVFKAWPHDYVAGEWDANAEDVLIERVVLTVGYWNRPNVAQLTDTLNAAGGNINQA